MGSQGCIFQLVLLYPIIPLGDFLAGHTRAEGPSVVWAVFGAFGGVVWGSVRFDVGGMAEAE